MRIQDLVVWGRCRGGKVGKAGRGPWAGPPVQTLILVLVLVLLRLNKEVLIDFPQKRMKGVCVCVRADVQLRPDLSRDHLPRDPTLNKQTSSRIVTTMTAASCSHMR